MAGPMRRTKEEIERERRADPLPRPVVWIVSSAAWLVVAVAELLEALILGLRAGLWCAFVIFGFGAAFFGIGAVLYVAIVWILSRFAV